MASDNVPAYIEAALQAGIIHPVGMLLQDAGWKSGPRLGKGTYRPSEYVMWRDYFENHAIKTSVEEWKFSQEDVLVSLVWGIASAPKNRAGGEDGGKSNHHGRKAGRYGRELSGISVAATSFCWCLENLVAVATS